MSVKTTLLLPPTATEPDERPTLCPRCGAPRLARHGTLQRALNDTEAPVVGVQRYRCSQCGFTFRHYPAGVGRSRRSRRLASLAVLLRGIGLSCVATAQVLQSTSARISSATVWRAMRQAGLQDLSESRRRVTVKVLDAGQQVPEQGVDVSVRFLSDADQKEITGVEVWRRRNEPLPSGLLDVLQNWGGRVLVGDRPVAKAGR